MGIQTDSTPLEDPKDHEICNVFALFKLLATKEQTQDLAIRYKAGNFGYGHAKTALLELVLNEFGTARDKFDHYMENPKEVITELKMGAEKARPIAQASLKRVRLKLGF